MLVDHLEVHEQVRGQRLQLEIGRFRRDLRLLANVGDQRVDEAARAEALAPGALDEARRVLRQRHAMAAQLLRQRFQQQIRLLPEHAGHEPFGAARVDLVQREERHRERHAVARRARLEVVRERHLDARHRHALRKQLGRHARRLVAHQIVARQIQQAQLVFRLPALAHLVAIPALERGARVNAGRNRLIVERVNQLVVDEHVLAARLVLELLDVGEQLAVVREERELRVEFAVDERAADEQLARARRVLPAERDAPPVIDGEPVQRRALERGDLRGPLLPVRLGQRFLQQMRADPLDPFGLDLRDAARIEAARLDELGRHHPAPRLLHERGARPQMELDAARAEVVRLVLGLEADVAEQARQQRQMDLLERRIGFVQPPAVLAHDGQELRVDIAPFAQPQVRQEMLPARVDELPVRLLVRDRLLEPRPDPQPLKELGALVGEAPVRLVGLLLRVDRALARVLHGQRARDHEHFAQRLLVARGEDHPADARIERQPRKLAAERRERVLVVDRAELVEQLIAVRDRAARRRLDERKRFDRRQMQRFHPQDHRRERRAQDFRIGETCAAGEIAFLVEADADAVGDAAAAARALVRGRLRDRLDLQLLDLVPVRIALHARQARVDDIADARHGQRRFGDVRREHDPPRVRRLEHALLLGRGQPREQRQDLGVRRMVLAQRLGRVADLALAGQEHEHVAGAFAAQLVDRVDDAVHQVALGLARALRAIAARARAFRVPDGGRPVIGDRPVAHLDRIQPPAHLDHRRGPLVAAEMAREALGVDRRRRDDQLQVRPPRQDLPEVAEQEIDVQAALVRLVDDEGVVRLQQRVGLRLGEQDPVRHQLDGGARGEVVGEAHLVADHLAERRAELLGDPAARRRRREPARLRVADQARAARAEAAAERQADLRQLGGLARARLAADDHDRVSGDRARDLVALARHGQAFGKRDRRNGIRRAPRARRMRCAGGFGAGVAALGARRARLRGRRLPGARRPRRSGAGGLRLARRARTFLRGTFRYIRHGGAL
ncbi:Uncharacterised protein [Burkholderia pseudomallei]|nr:Uncharacterised protein [Burkholderia pseudomallei]VBS38970.1 Uncharacterised protein [Burkholderia pseudomallei]VCM40358.1 Uncharacterised protein [Burkholderia pseudomallei]